jgi:hypothetical protein
MRAIPLLTRVDALRKALEIVIGQRLTFQGEKRPEAEGPIVRGRINVDEVLGYCGSFEADGRKGISTLAPASSSYLSSAWWSFDSYTRRPQPFCDRGRHHARRTPCGLGALGQDAAGLGPGERKRTCFTNSRRPHGLLCSLVLRLNRHQSVSVQTCETAFRRSPFAGLCRPDESEVCRFHAGWRLDLRN